MTVRCNDWGRRIKWWEVMVGDYGEWNPNPYRHQEPNPWQNSYYTRMRIQRKKKKKKEVEGKCKWNKGKITQIERKIAMNWWTFGIWFCHFVIIKKEKTWHIFSSTFCWVLYTVLYCCCVVLLSSVQSALITEVDWLLTKCSVQFRICTDFESTIIINMLLDDIARWMYCIQSNIAFIWMDGVVRWVVQTLTSTT